MRAIRPCLRLLLLIALVIGLVPGWPEFAEQIEHLLHDGHVAHGSVHAATAESEDHETPGDEHGCTPLAHNCGCHVSMAGLLPPVQALPALRIRVPSDPLVAAPSRQGPWRSTAPPSRPPIG